MAYGTPAQTDPTAVMGRRVVAYIIDVVLTSGVLVALLALTKSNSYVGAPSGACQTLRDSQGLQGMCLQFGSHVYTWKGGAAAADWGIALLAGFANNVMLQGIGGASVGKLILGLRVVDSQGQVCGVGRAFVRWLLLVVDSICGIVGLIVAGVTHPHRRIGDMAAGTYVVGIASAGRPVVAPPAYQYAYPQPGAQEWSPPGSVPPPAPGWGTAPPPAAWGAPPPGPGAGQPPVAQPPAWGAPPPPPPGSPAPPAWGTTPPADAPPPPAWGAPAPAPTPAPPAEPSGWGAPPPTWGTPEPPPPAPPPAPSGPAVSPWAAPTPAPAPTPPPPAPADAQSGWAAPEPAPNPEPTPAPPTEPPPAPPTEPPPARPTEPPPPAPATPPSAEGESWWNKAFNGDDEPET